MNFARENRLLNSAAVRLPSGICGSEIRLPKAGFSIARVSPSNCRLRKDPSYITLPRLMVARQPMFRLNWFTGRDPF